MQFKVPQDVLRPDKIVAFLTLRQLIMVAIGGGISYSLYIILSKQYLLEIWLPPVLFVSIITLAFAFFTFHDIPFERLALLFVEYKFKPRARTWQKMEGDYLVSVFGQLLKKPSVQDEKVEGISEQERRKKLIEATRAVDTAPPGTTANNVTTGAKTIK